MDQWLQQHRDAWEFLFQLLTVVGTVGAVLVALWLALRTDWRERRTRPMLKLGINFGPPDCGFDKQRDVWRGRRGGFLDGSTFEREIVRDAYWFRMFVENTGRSPAHDVEIILSDMMVRPAPAMPYQPHTRFLLSDGVWTHGADVLPQLLPGARRLLDVGSMMRPMSAGQKAFFRFQITVVPESGYNVVEPGDYQFTVTVGARNADLQSVVVRLRFDGDWSADTGTMFRDHVSLQLAERGS
jgi:hypothetical protein